MRRERSRMLNHLLTRNVKDRFKACGKSGAPVLAEDGRLVAIITAFGLGDTRQVPFAATDIAYAVPAAAIESYLAEVLWR